MQRWHVSWEHMYEHWTYAQYFGLLAAMDEEQHGQQPGVMTGTQAARMHFGPKVK